MERALPREAVADQLAPNAHHQAGAGGLAAAVEQAAQELGLTAWAQSELVGVARRGLGGRDLYGQAGALVDQGKQLGVDRIDTRANGLKAGRGGLGIGLGHTFPRKRRFGA